MGSWQARIRAIKQGNPNAKVLATFHATEIWAEDINIANRWLPPKCLMRSANGSPCSWWENLVFTNNLFVEECWQYAVDNAMRAFDGGLAEAGIDVSQRSSSPALAALPCFSSTAASSLSKAHACRVYFWTASSRTL
jgi:hypothetical protein